MFVLFVDMGIKLGVAEGLEKTYIENFRPAISAQEGFRSVELLRPNKDGGEYRLMIAFSEHALQKKWVATDLHQVVWPQIEGFCAGYTIKDFTSV